MGVEGLTRENVASHLQKYRLQLRKEGKDTLDNGNAVESDRAVAHSPAATHAGGQAESGSEGVCACMLK